MASTQVVAIAEALAQALRVQPGSAEVDVAVSLDALSTQVLLTNALINAAAGLVLDGDYTAKGEAGIVAAANLLSIAAAIKAAVVGIVGSTSVTVLASEAIVVQAAASILAALSVAGVATQVTSGECTVTISGALAVAAWKLALEDLFAFTGAFVTGKVIVIDMDAKTVTVDGVNALHQTNSTFFKFAEGVSQVIYEDDEAARTVAASIVHKNRWV
jgi:hypothetical protein